MATTKKRVREVRRPGQDKHLTPSTLREFGKKRMTTYAVAVNLDRSVPDLYDGLKPVHRRIIWGMANSGGRNIQKSAEYVGFVLGKLHPHGDSAVYDAMVTMVNQPCPPLFGNGNWGSMTDGPAAYRYTEAKLTNYGLSFVEPDYIAKEVTSFVPNFNDRWVEPVTLPAQLPNVIINGVNVGIGVGITAKIPSFSADSVIEVVKRMFKGEKLKALDFAKALKFEYKYGGQMVQTKENKAAYLNMFKGSIAKVQFESRLEVQRDQKRIVISDWSPGLKLETFVKKVRAMPETLSCANSAGATTYTVECKPAYNYDQFDKWVEKIRKATTASMAFRINVTRRTATTVDGVTTFETLFEDYSIPQLLVQWCRMRVQLELKSLAHQVVLTEERIDYAKTMIMACDHIDAIIKVIRNSDTPEEALCKKLKIHPHQAKWICDLQLRKISKLDEGKYKNDLKAELGTLKQLNAWQAKPRTKVLLDLERISETLKKDRAFQYKEDNQDLVVV